MTEPAKGFLTSQGRFFESETEAKLDEACEALRGICDVKGMDFDQFISIVLSIRDPLFVYLTQYAILREEVRDGTETRLATLNNTSYTDPPRPNPEHEVAATTQRRPRKHKKRKGDT